MAGARGSTQSNSRNKKAEYEGSGNQAPESNSVLETRLGQREQIRRQAVP
jgi:hypothetical protein